MTGASLFTRRIAVAAGLTLAAAGCASYARAVVAPASGHSDMGTSVTAGESQPAAAGAGVAADKPGAPVETGRLVVSLLPTAKVTGRWVRLGDIAELSGLSEVRLASLRDGRLQRAPLAGAEKVLGVEELTRRLRTLGVVEAFTIAGAETVTISASVRALGGEEFVKFGHDFLASKVGEAGGEVQIEDPAAPRALTVPEGEVEYRAEAPARRLAGLVPVAVEAWSGGERVARVLLSYRVRARAAVVRAAKSLEPGQIIAAEDLEVSELDLAGVPEDAMTSPDSLVGQRVTRPVAAGGWLRRSAVAQPLKVRRGATVSVIAKIGNVTAKVAAQSRQDGAMGEVISVMNPGSKRLLRARVVDENVVEAVMP